MTPEVPWMALVEQVEAKDPAREDALDALRDSIVTTNPGDSDDPSFWRAVYTELRSRAAEHGIAITFNGPTVQATNRFMEGK